jgi:hypothetical protein
MTELTEHNIWFDFVIPLLIGVVGMIILAYWYKNHSE